MPLRSTSTLDLWKRCPHHLRCHLLWISLLCDRRVVMIRVDQNIPRCILEAWKEKNVIDDGLMTFNAAGALTLSRSTPRTTLRLALNDDLFRNLLASILHNDIIQSLIMIKFRKHSDRCPRK